MDSSQDPAAQDPSAPAPALIIAAAVLAVGLAVTVAVIGLTSGGEPPAAPPPATLALPAVDAPQADTPDCARLLNGLPDDLPSGGQTLPRRPLAAGSPPGAAAWGSPDPVVLRCGLPKPALLTSTSKLRQVSGVRWLPAPGSGSTTFYAVDRAVYVAVTIPDGSGTGPLQELSEAVRRVLDPQKVRP